MVSLLLAAALSASGVDVDAPVVKVVEREYVAGAELVLEVEIVDANELFDPAVNWRLQGAQGWERTALQKQTGSLYAARLGRPPAGSQIEYFVEAYDVLGNGPGLAGTAEAPLSLKTPVRVPSRQTNAVDVLPPLYIQKPFAVGPAVTVAVGTVVAVVGAALFLGAASDVVALDAKYASRQPRTTEDALATRDAIARGRLVSGISFAGAAVAAGGIVWWLWPSDPVGEEGLQLGVSGSF